jgi:thiosulfate/3-mercaptopyruvate sulfurtransferase
VDGPLVDAAWLRDHLGDPGLVVVDCRWLMGDRDAGRRAYLNGHVPGASFLDVDEDLSAPPGRGGRHPLPSAADFEAAARRAGISAASRVVGYGEGAPRLWWLLRHFGHEAAAVLDGGFESWRGAVASGPEPVPPGDFTARPRRDDVVSAEELSGRVLVDARAPERYRGEVEPIDPVAGHIPGALNLPYEEVAPGGRFLPPEELRERLPEGEFVAYCGSGVTSCVLLVAAEAAGVGPGRLYPGSWSEWCALQQEAESTSSRSSGPGGRRSR